MQIANNVYATDDIDSNPPIVYKTRILWLLLFGSMKRENSWRRISSSVLYDLSANCMRCINVCTRTCASISGTVVPCSMQSCCCFVLFAVMQHTMRHLIGMRKLSALSFWCVCVCVLWQWWSQPHALLFCWCMHHSQYICNNNTEWRGECGSNQSGRCPPTNRTKKQKYWKVYHKHFHTTTISNAHGGFLFS